MVTDAAWRQRSCGCVSYILRLKDLVFMSGTVLCREPGVQLADSLANR